VGTLREDILEQLVDDYLQLQGYFTRHNMKFRPRSDHPRFDQRQDSNHSDIDVLGFNPLLKGHRRVLAASCKSWQSGFDVRAKLQEIAQNKTRSGRASWKFFRELVQPKWSEEFVEAVEAATGTSRFTYVTAVTSVRGDRASWENHAPFRNALRDNPIQMITMTDMVSLAQQKVGTTVVASQLGRTLQLLRAAGLLVNA
jgi:hypothetical protein